MYNSQYEKDFMDRISEPLNDGQVRFNDGEIDYLLRNILRCWLEYNMVTQKDVLSEKEGIEIAKFIEEFGLQHLVSGGWTPLKKGA